MGVEKSYTFHTAEEDPLLVDLFEVSDSVCLDIGERGAKSLSVYWCYLLEWDNIEPVI